MRCLYPKPECTKQRREEAQKEDTNGRKEGESQHPPANDVPSIASNVGGSKFLEQRSTQSLGEAVSKVVLGRNTLRHNHFEFGQLAGIVASDTHVFVGLMVDGVEDQGDHSRAIDIDRNRSVRLPNFQFVKEVHEPLSFLCSEEQGGIFGVIGAGGDISM